MNFEWIKRFTPAGVIAGAFVFIGILLAVTIDMRFLLFTGLGAFGPGILRELGFLNDQDEFARLATYRAGYLASLFAGSIAVILIAVLKAGSVDLEHESLALALILSMIWLVTIFATIHKFWGVQKAVFRILIIFGTFWFFFVALSHLHEPLILLRESVIVAPFFMLAWLSIKWPRLAGILIIAIAIYCIFLFRLHVIKPGRDFNNEVLGNALIFLIFNTPLLVAGFALLMQKPNTDQIKDGDHEQDL